MKKEIKFRGISIFPSDNGEYVYGFLLIHTPKGGREEEKYVIRRWDEDGYHSKMVKKETIGQLTGTDENGEEIYELCF